MRAKNWLLAFLLMIMPIIAFCNELDDADNCKYYWSTSKNKNIISFPSDKDCYQTSVSYDYMTEYSINALTRESYKWSIYSATGNCGYKIDESLYFTIKSENGEYGPYEWNEKLYEADIMGNYKDTYGGSVASSYLSIS